MEKNRTATNFKEGFYIFAEKTQTDTMRIIKVFQVFAAALLALVACSQKPDYRVCAFIWPSCHDDSLAHELLWPEGIGEWEIINAATPHFEGHQQPKHPLWGCEMDDDPVVFERWIKTARKYGVNTFVFDWYWFDAYPFLEGALNDGFLKAPSCKEMDFYLMWANHDVQEDYWSCYRNAGKTDLMFTGKVTPDEFKQLVDRVIKQYFWRDNYVKVDGCPVFMIYSVDRLLASFDKDYARTREALDYFRAEVVKAGYPGLHLQADYWNNGYEDQDYLALVKKQNEELGFDSVAFYNMPGTDDDYNNYCANCEKYTTEVWSHQFDVPYFPTVSIGYDDTPRYPGKTEAVHLNKTPQRFEQILRWAKSYVDERQQQPRWVYINAWNEWVEDSYLLPDVENGFGYLEAVKNVFPPSKR